MNVLSAEDIESSSSLVRANVRFEFVRRLLILSRVDHDIRCRICGVFGPIRRCRGAMKSLDI